MFDSEEPSDVCPECGGVDAYEKRYATGGGWRSEFRCRECHRVYAPSDGWSDVTAELFPLGKPVGEPL